MRSVGASVNKWQSIKTAPKDGTRILAYGMAYPQLIQHKGEFWGVYHGEVKEPFVMIIWWHELWYDDEIEVGDNLYRKERKLSSAHWRPEPHAFNPTHWMALPENP